MSRTNKHILKKKAEMLDSFDDLPMKDQIHFPEMGGKKFKVELSDRVLGVTTLGKLVTKNANRSVIKAVRQEGKKEISKELE